MRKNYFQVFFVVAKSIILVHIAAMNAKRKKGRVSVELTDEQRRIAELVAQKDGTSMAHVLERAIQIGLVKVKTAIDQLYASADENPSVGQAAAVAETPARYSAPKKGAA